MTDRRLAGGDEQRMLIEAVDAYVSAVNGPFGLDDNWSDDVNQTKARLATAACIWRVRQPAEPVPHPSCECGSVRKESARFGHPHLSWCVTATCAIPDWRQNEMNVKK
jgi:hypothetical protein